MKMERATPMRPRVQIPPRYHLRGGEPVRFFDAFAGVRGVPLFFRGNPNPDEAML